MGSVTVVLALALVGVIIACLICAGSLGRLMDRSGAALGFGTISKPDAYVHALRARCEALEKEVDALRERRDPAVASSPDGRLKVHVSISDDHKIKIEATVDNRTRTTV